MSEDRKVIAVLLTIAVGLVSLIWFIAHVVGSQEASASCYENFRNVYSWESARAELDHMMTDKRLSVSECKRMYEVYDEAKITEVRNATLKDYDSYGR
jgi:hypothetical protein